MNLVSVIIVGLVIFLVWGLIGSSQVEKIGNTCDVGINKQGSTFCWFWHQNILGDIQISFENRGEE